MSQGKYIYCIISARGGADSGFNSLGIGDKEVNLVHYKDIAAAVSDTSIIDFDGLDEAELTRNVAIHQKVNEKIMKILDACPMAFGIIAPSQEEVLSILEKAELQFKTALAKIKGRVEFVVQAWWDGKKGLEELVASNPEIKRLRDKAAKGGILALPIKLKLGKLIFDAVKARRQAYIKNIEEILNTVAHDSALNKVTEDDMLVNLSFLIEKVRESELDKKMQELGEKYDRKLRFKYIGPMPPYSFVNINLALGNFELVDKARKELKLANEATFDEIKKAYYKLAHQFHPDKHRGNLEKAEEKMGQITEAYNVLENYCQSVGEKPKYSFKEKNVKDSLIIK